MDSPVSRNRNGEDVLVRDIFDIWNELKYDGQEVYTVLASICTAKTDEGMPSKITHFAVNQFEIDIEDEMQGLTLVVTMPDELQCSRLTLEALIDLLSTISPDAKDYGIYLGFWDPEKVRKPEAEYFKRHDIPVSWYGVDAETKELTLVGHLPTAKKMEMQRILDQGTDNP